MLLEFFLSYGKAAFLAAFLLGEIFSVQEIVHYFFYVAVLAVDGVV